MSLLQMIQEKRTARKAILDGQMAMVEKRAKDGRAVFNTEEESQFTTRESEAKKLETEISSLEVQADREMRLSDELRKAGTANHGQRQAGREDVTDAGTSAGDEKWAKMEPAKRHRLANDITRQFILNGPSGYENLGEEHREYIKYTRARGAANRDLAPHEQRALGGSTAGIETVPQDFEYKLEIALKYYGGVLETSEYIDTDNGQLLPYPSINDTAESAEQTAENAAVTVTAVAPTTTPADPVYGVVNFSAYMLDSGIVQVPIQLLQDSAFDVEGYLTPLLATRIGRKVNALGTTGNGSSTLTGIVTASIRGPQAAAMGAIAYSDILNLIHSVDPAYRKPMSAGEFVGFQFADSILLAIKKLVDSNGRPLFLAGGTAEGINGKTPDMINGFPYTINQDMASTFTASAKTMLFGNMSKFKIRRVRGLQMFRFAERYMDHLQIGLLAFQRYDSNLVDAGMHPVQYLQQPGS